MLDSYRQTQAILIGLLVVAFIYYFSPSADFQPRGLLLPAKKTLKPVEADQVHFLNSVNAPYSVLGTISVEMQLTPGKQDQDVKVILAKAQKLAASVGANAIIFGTGGYLAHPPLSALPLSQVHWVFRGLAIKVNSPILPLAPGIVMPSY